MLRYLAELQENRDLSLVHSMIPLGSCTMKLNATAEMMPVISWPELHAHLHPFAPRGASEPATTPCSQRPGALALPRSRGSPAVLASTQRWLAGRVRRPARDSRLVPRPSRRRTVATVCLIPTSAHGTNPASAVMAGMRVVPVHCRDGDGNDRSRRPAREGSEPLTPTSWRR